MTIEARYATEFDPPENVSSRPSKGARRIMVVDDEQHNRELLCDLLTSEGFCVVEAEDGIEALEKAEAMPPDAILLDVMMPRLDGFETCRRIRRHPALKHLPVLMITALNDRPNRLAGIEAGANDFLSKPIDVRDTMLRIRNAVVLKRLLDQAKDDFEHIRSLEMLRDSLVHMIVHDLRAPLTGLIGYLDLVMDDFQSESPQPIGLLREAMRQAQVLNEMISVLLDVNRLETGKMPLQIQRQDLVGICRAAVRTLGAIPNNLRLQFTGEHRAAVPCDASVIQRVVQNLLSNAVKYSPGGGTIVVYVSKLSDAVELEVIDQGPGIPEEDRDKVFDKFFQIHRKEALRVPSSGLGLTFCKLAVEAHGGSIIVAATPGRGCTFRVILPLKPITPLV